MDVVHRNVPGVLLEENHVGQLTRYEASLPRPVSYTHLTLPTN